MFVLNLLEMNGLRKFCNWLKNVWKFFKLYDVKTKPCIGMMMWKNFNYFGKFFGRIIATNT